MKSEKTTTLSKNPEYKLNLKLNKKVTYIWFNIHLLDAWFFSLYFYSKNTSKWTQYFCET